MKKAKIMLTAITVLAVVGGALAFKANVAFSDTYCTTSPANYAGFCDVALGNVKTTSEETGAVRLYYTLANQCNSSTPCQPSTFIIGD